MTKNAIRQIIREEANEVGARFRITTADEVHFCEDPDRHPGTQGSGWYMVAQSSEALAMQILRERHHSQMRAAGMV